MAIQLLVSNNLHGLAESLAESLSGSARPVFEPITLVTQTEGMNNWLKQQLAGRLGIAANLRFLKPNDLIHQLYFTLGGERTEVLSAGNLSWLLFKLLGSQDFIRRFPIVAAYYQQGSGTAAQQQEQDLKRMALAEKTADLLDQYQIYRPDMIQEWNSMTESPAGIPDWQRYLWQQAARIAEGRLPDKTKLGAFILDALKDPAQQQRLSARMPAVHIFGLSITTAYHLEILYELSRLVDVCFYMLNPAPLVYWFDQRSEKQLMQWERHNRKNLAPGEPGNALLTNWGKVIQESFGMLFKHDEFLNAYEEVAVQEPVPGSLLHKIQHDIFHSATTERLPITPDDIQDGSITISSCYTIAREVEVLYNYLVQLVDQKGMELAPRDIVVMVSDIDAYAPYIRAVFDNAPYHFRFTIADETLSGGDNIFSAMQALMSLHPEDLKAEQVLQLLDHAAIRRRFGITDTALIREVVARANIRFGIKGSTADDTHLLSWQYGLKRIMYGICMSGCAEYGSGDERFYPLDMVEGAGAQELVRFCHFAKVLIDSLQERSRPRSVADWVRYTEQLLYHMLVEPGEEADEDYQQIMEALARYNLVDSFMDDQVAFPVFSQSLLQSLGQQTRSALFANGGITFCSLIPMRSIPFKVVAMLGLSFDKFPRRERSMGFNKMQEERRPGDRNIRDNDKHLFLETILSAQQMLYISYPGQSAKDNTILPPSALVDELLDYIEAGAGMPLRQELICRHPLHSFSKKYEAGDSGLYSYLDHKPKQELRWTEPAKELSREALTEIKLQDLCGCFKNPFKTYYNKTLGIYYHESSSLLPDTELFELDHLQQWNLKNELLQLDEEGVGILQNKLQRTGALPLKNMGIVAIREVEEAILPVRALFQKYTEGREASRHTITVQLDGCTLSGTLQQVYEGRLLVVCYSKKETKYRLQAYIEFLAGCAAGVVQELVYISGPLGKACTVTAVDAATAVGKLEALVQRYIRALDDIMPFWPNLEPDVAGIDDLDYPAFLKKLKDCLERHGHECDDPYLMPEYYRNFFDEAAFSQYQQICKEVLLPISHIFSELQD